MAHVLDGYAVHRLFAASLQPMARAIGASLGPRGVLSLFDQGTEQIGRARSGLEIAMAMPKPEGPAGTAPRMLKELLFAAQRDLGDGTTQLALIAIATFTQATRAGAPAVALANAIDSARPTVTALLQAERCAEIDLVSLARSSGADARLANELASILKQTGPDGIIEVSEALRPGMELIAAPGFMIDAEPIGDIVDLSNVSVLVANEVISDFGHLAGVLEGFVKKRKSLVIAARDITGAALATLLQNQKAGIVRLAACRPRDAGQRAADVLEDLAIATGATLVSDRQGTQISSLRPAMLGHATGFSATKARALFTSPNGDAALIAQRRSTLASEIARNRHLSLDREHARRRRSRLAGNWREIKLAGENADGTATMIAAARSATACMTSAMEGGAIPGGGEALANVAAKLSAEHPVIAHGLLAIARQLNMKTDPAIQDPLPLQCAIVDQALSFTTQLLRTAAIIHRA